MVKLILVEETDFLRLFVRAGFNGITNFELLGNYQSSSEAISAISLNSPDMVFLDLQSNGGKGMEVMRDIAREFPEIKVSVASSCTDPICLQVFNEMRAYAVFDKAHTMPSDSAPAFICEAI